VKRLSCIIAILALGFGTAACDTQGDALLSAAELSGDWDVERASIRVGGVASIDLISVLEGQDRATMIFFLDGTFTAVLTVEEPRVIEIPNTDLSITLESGSFDGFYSLRADQRLAFSLEGVPGELLTDYRYTPGTQAELRLTLRSTAESRAILAGLLGSAAIADLITGGELTLRRTGPGR